ncbi:DHA1 family putative efflux transporter-like MFS transporter [Paenibacillus taihuensis]|uniref:DHA1 family putative efflux transporter-like MFS transporter n=1 Tax=Paenibacillus taihuensis TaxID=1156355 RepID=A0A3D9RRJ5_9BACL|nr:MFS transporter [Paenibacillus taihuensis]REE78701.1 DHA1 family putative efflux transporter-like MFS transporter [Paenibacillus taihuensis]
MNRLAIYVLALGVFLTATSELVVSGILRIIAGDLHISIALAGQLITAYSLSFAIGTPVFVSLTSRMERKKVLLGSLAIFILGSILSTASSTIVLLMISRIILGISAGVYLVVTFGTVAKLVPADKLGGAISIIVLGFSSAMILGVPVGIIISSWLNWRAIFLILSLLSLLIAYIIYRHLPQIDGDAPVSFRQQFKVLGSVVIVSGLFLTFLKESGNSIFFTYLTSYLQDILHLKTSNISVMMLAFGIVGAVGSRLSGYGVDRWGAARMITASMVAHVLVLAILPTATGSLVFEIVLLSLMVMAMFTSGPAIQTYFIQQAPLSSNLVLSLNTSIIHLGLASGAGAGGVMLDATSTLRYHPWLASTIVALGLAAAAVSFTMRFTAPRADRSSKRDFFIQKEGHR